MVEARFHPLLPFLPFSFPPFPTILSRLFYFMYFLFTLPFLTLPFLPLFLPFIALHTAAKRPHKSSLGRAVSYLSGVRGRSYSHKAFFGIFGAHKICLVANI